MTLKSQVEDEECVSDSRIQPIVSHYQYEGALKEKELSTSYSHIISTQSKFIDIDIDRPVVVLSTELCNRTNNHDKVDFRDNDCKIELRIENKVAIVNDSEIQNKLNSELIYNSNEGIQNEIENTINLEDLSNNSTLNSLRRRKVSPSKLAPTAHLINMVTNQDRRRQNEHENDLSLNDEALLNKSRFRLLIADHHRVQKDSDMHIPGNHFNLRQVSLFYKLVPCKWINHISFISF
jgi:hypothetical protein